MRCRSTSPRRNRTGFFGMNFTFLTGQIPNETWSFFALRPGLLLASIVGFWMLFRRKGWLTSTT